MVLARLRASPSRIVFSRFMGRAVLVTCGGTCLFDFVLVTHTFPINQRTTSPIRVLSRAPARDQ